MLNINQLSIIIEIIVREIRTGEFCVSAFQNPETMERCIEEVLPPLTERERCDIRKLIKGAQAGVIASNSCFESAYESAVVEAISLHTEATR